MKRLKELRRTYVTGIILGFMLGATLATGVTIFILRGV